MSLFTEYLGAVAAYEQEKKLVNVGRAKPPEKSLETLASEAEGLFFKLVKQGVERDAPGVATDTLNQQFRAL